MNDDWGMSDIGSREYYMERCAALTKELEDAKRELERAWKAYNESLIHATNAEQYLSGKLAAERTLREDAEKERDGWKEECWTVRKTCLNERVQYETALKWVSEHMLGPFQIKLTVAEIKERSKQ